MAEDGSKNMVLAAPHQKVFICNIQKIMKYNSKPPCRAVKPDARGLGGVARREQRLFLGYSDSSIAFQSCGIPLALFRTQSAPLLKKNVPADATPSSQLLV